jgi:hypothetical protein
VLGPVIAPVFERILGDHRTSKAQAGSAPEIGAKLPFLMVDI